MVAEYNKMKKKSKTVIYIHKHNIKTRNCHNTLLCANVVYYYTLRKAAYSSDWTYIVNKRCCYIIQINNRVTIQYTNIL